MICPLCGRELEMTIEDDEGNIRNDPDYERDPYGGLWYGIMHPDYCNDCVLTDTHYMDAYPTREGAEKEMNRFQVLVNTFRPGHEKAFDELMVKVTGMIAEDW